MYACTRIVFSVKGGLLASLCVVFISPYCCGTWLGRVEGSRPEPSEEVDNKNKMMPDPCAERGGFGRRRLFLFIELWTGNGSASSALT